MIELTDFVNICRLCLNNHGDDSVNLFSRHKETSEFIVAEMVESFCSVQVQQDDGLPENVCNDCWSIVSSMQNLQMVSLQSERRLSKILNSNGSIVETDVLQHSGETLYFKIEFVDPQLNEESSTKVKAEPLDQESLESSTKSRTRRKVKTGESLSSVTKSRTQEKGKTEPSNGELLDSAAKSRPRGRGKAEQSENATSEKKRDRRRCDKKKFSCEICGKLVARDALKYHLNRHKDIRPYKCGADNCDKYFPSPSEAKLHFRKVHIYSITRPFKCDICGAGFVQTSAVVAHRAYHFDPEVPCSICGQLYHDNKALRKHSLVHSGERKFSCSECSKSFQTRYTLKTHMRIHSNEKPFSCTMCPKAFAYKCLLKAHIEKSSSKRKWTAGGDERD